MSWGHRRGWQERAEPACPRGAKCRARRNFLDFDKWRRPKGNAGLVQIAGAPTLAACELPQIAGRRAREVRPVRSCETVTTCRALRIHFAASLRIIASRTPASAILNSTAFAAWFW